MPIPLRSHSIYASRMYSRRPLDLRAHLLTRPAGGGRVTVVHGRTVDLSRSGAGVTLTSELAPGTEVVFCLRLPRSGRALCLRAFIVRRNGFRAGLEFAQPTAAQRLLLLELCKD